ncbi:MAG: DNA topoisomerase III [Acholeplasmataceae bacterium]
MNRSLVLAEKPSVARDIARVIRADQKRNGWFEGHRYVVTWALGHLVELAEPARYDAKYQTWRLEDLPIIPASMKLEIIPQTRKQFSTVKNLLMKSEIRDVIIATDAGREGELVARWTLLLAKNRKPIKRLWISSVTDKAIREGFTKLKDGSSYIPLFHSAVARAESDWLVGINATRALTTKYNAQLSTGRVQTPTIALVKRREDLIRSFKPKTYAEMELHAGGTTFKWVDDRGQTRLFDAKKADTITERARGQRLSIERLRSTEKKTMPPLLYDLTTLQKEANQRYGYSARMTLSIAQSLYEHHKVLTYPRTDSRYITKDIVPTIKERLRALDGPEYHRIVNKLLKKSFSSLRSVNDALVSDHHAIIPTEEALIDGDEHESRIYAMVVERFLSSLLDPYVYEQTVIEASARGERFVARGNVVRNLGWKEVTVDPDENPDERIIGLPDLRVKQRIAIDRVERIGKKTSPPPYFTEGTLIQAMENPSDHAPIDDRKLKDTLKKTGGLGTVATRADILEKLFDMNYIELKDSAIRTTSKGRQILDLAPEDLRSPLLTAKWERKLDDIAHGRLDKDRFIAEIKAYTQRIISEIKTSRAEYRHDNITSKTCPQCGKPLLEVKQKMATVLKCPDRSCGYRKTVSRITNARCPVCHKRLELHGEGDQAVFVCSCGHRERMSSFEKRKKEEKKKMSNKEAKQAIRHLNDESDRVKNSALADQLKDLLK